MTTFTQGKITYPWDRNAEEIEKLKSRVNELEKRVRKTPYMAVEEIAPRTFKVLSHIVIFGSGSCAHSNWYYNEHKGCVHDNCIKLWLKIDGEEIRPKRNDAGLLWEYLSIVETESDFQYWLNTFVK